MNNLGAVSNLNIHINAFLNECEARNLSVSTLKSYRLNLRQFCGFLEDRVGGVTGDNVFAFISYLQEKYNPASVNQKIATITLFMDYLTGIQVIPENPAKKLDIRQHKQEAPFLTVGMDVITAILQSAYREKELSKPGSYSYLTVLRDIAVLELLFISGMRVSELCRLSPYDVNLKAKVVHIQGAGNKLRTLQIENDETLKALSEYQREFWTQMVVAEQYFVNRRGCGLSEQSVRNLLKRYAASASVEQKITPKVLRDSVATLLAAEETDLVSLQHLLGHDSITRTQRYVKTVKENLKTYNLRDQMKLMK